MIIDIIPMFCFQKPYQNHQLLYINSFHKTFYYSIDFYRLNDIFGVKPFTKVV